MTALTSGAAVVAALLLLLAASSPAVLVTLITRAYPAGDPRRDELVAELHLVGAWSRFCWVLELVEAAVRDGITERRKAGVERRRAELAETEQRWVNGVRFYFVNAGLALATYLLIHPIPAWLTVLAAAVICSVGPLFVLEISTDHPWTLIALEDTTTGRRIVVKFADFATPGSLRPTGYRALLIVQMRRQRMG